jgi:aminopeptidase N
VLLALLTGCTIPAVRGETVTIAPDGQVAPEPGELAVDPDDPRLDVALSEPAEDSYYPEVGDPGVDALLYDLALAWAPRTRTLTGRATIVLRATADAPRLQLDLGPALRVGEVRLDGEVVEHRHPGKDLVVDAAVAADERYVLEVDYGGVPEPVAAPTTRDDFDRTGFQTTAGGEAWTMQEPFGAYTWYPVNDHPSDKALYEFTLTVPSPWVGVANGRLARRDEGRGRTTTHFVLEEPAASYLTTVAFGDYTTATDTSAGGVDITYWVPTAEPGLIDDLRAAADGLDWLEAILGPYPFDTLGFVLVDSQSGMETQTLVTLGKTDYTLSSKVLVHEMAHHWYGDQVTPDDWRDVWMSEGMAMYLQGMWEAEQSGLTLDQQMDVYAGYEVDHREESGPPAAYEPGEFGEGNVYYGPALMWHELRERIGDDEFFAMVRAWPAARDNLSTGREDYLAWVEEETGQELTGFFDAWLLGETTPPRD